MANEFKVKNGLITPNILSKGDTDTNSLSIQSVQVINSSGQWVGSPTGLQGPQGTQGIQGIQGIQGPAASSNWVRKTTAYTAISGDRLIADTSGGTFAITLPATPAVGACVAIVDGNNWFTTNLTIGRNGSTIEGTAEDLIIDINGIRVDLIYDGTTWEVITLASPNELPTQTGNSGKYLTTNGTVPNWGVIDSYPSQTGNNGKYLSTNGSAVSWSTVISGATITNDTTTNTNYYLGMANITSGSWTSAYTSDSQLYFNPSTGTLSSTNFNSLSDIKFKTDIINIDNVFSILNQIYPVSFKWINNNNQAYGVIAQELEKILPNLVETSENGKTVSYIQLIPLLIQAVNELKTEIDKLKGVLL